MPVNNAMAGVDVLEKSLPGEVNLPLTGGFGAREIAGGDGWEGLHRPRVHRIQNS
jgi:hypothetical protein